MRLCAIFLTAFLAFALTACGNNADDDVTRIAFIGAPSDLKENGVRLSPAAQHLRGATAEGLVSLNSKGEIVPGLAERWIVTDDGLSYIFRLKNVKWSDGATLTGENARAALERNLRQLKGTSLGLDLSIISDTRAMTGRVIEIRLKSAMPQFLEVLAQPELGLRRDGKGTGPMEMQLTKGKAVLDVISGKQDNLPELDENSAQYRQIVVESVPAEEAASAFQNGEVDAVFNGRLLSLSLADTGPLTRGTVRLDVVFGLFGLQVTNTKGLLADPARREALAMAIERETLLDSFGVGGWVPSTRIVPSGLPGSPIEGAERWADLAISDRQAQAAQRIAVWKNGEGGGEAKITISLPRKPGSNQFYTVLAEDLATIGVTLVRVAPGDPSDLVLVDRLARYGDARWFLNQFNCSLKRGPCSAEADALVNAAVSESDPATRAGLLAGAENTLLRSNLYIPLGAPVRWSLIRGGVDGFIENPAGIHPLFPIAVRPI